ncbi:MAG: ABC transporter permease [Pirellulales bacterium]|nr:ABC transporter permease [Pirellulales bacterium]
MLHASAKAYVRRQAASPLLALQLVVAYVAVVAAFRPEVLSADNLNDVVVSAAPLAVLAIGQTFVVIAGGIDLSLTALVSYASVVGATVMTGTSSEPGGSVLAGLLAMACTGLVVGAVHGASVAWGKMPAFLVTLASLMFLDGLAEWQTRSQPIGNLPASFIDAGFARWLGVPAPVVVAAVAGGAAHLLLAHTVYGRQLYAVGQNAATARVSGVPVTRTIVVAYLVSGLMAAVATVIYMLRLETGKPDLVGASVLLDCIAAVVIGGASLRGGSGSVRGAAFGALFLTLVGNSLNLFGNLQIWHVLTIKGALILLVAALESYRAGLRGGHAA